MNFDLKVGDKGRTRGGELSYEVIKLKGDVDPYRTVLVKLFEPGVDGETIAEYPMNGMWLGGVESPWDLLYPEIVKKPAKKVMADPEEYFQSKVAELARTTRQIEKTIDDARARRKVVKAEFDTFNAMIARLEGVRDAHLNKIRELITGKDMFDQNLI